MTTLWIILSSWIWLQVGYVAGVLDTRDRAGFRLRNSFRSESGGSATNYPPGSREQIRGNST